MNKEADNILKSLSSSEHYVHDGATTTPFTLANSDEDLDNLVRTDDDMSFSAIMAPAVAASSTSTLDLDGVKVHGGDRASGFFSTSCQSSQCHPGSTPTNLMEYIQSRVGRLMQTRTYKRSVLALIALCSAFLGLRTAQTWTQTQRTILDDILMGFLIIFTMEVWLNILYFQQEVIHMGWIVSDIIILLASWLINPTLIILRSFRLIKGLRNAVYVTETKHVVQTLLSALPRVMSLAFIMLIVYYIFAVLFTDLFGSLYTKDYTDEDYFGRLDRTTMTLFQIMTLDGWADITKQVSAVYWWSWALFILFIIVTTFFMGSLMVAIMCEAMSAASALRMRNSLEMNGQPTGATTIHASPSILTTGGASICISPPMASCIFPGVIGVESMHTTTPDAFTMNPSMSAGMAGSARLERKLDDLTATVDRLTQLQVAMQESLNMLLMQQGQQKGQQLERQSRTSQQIM